jgi:DNA-binding NarL/FixJ family response regulator
MTTDRRGGDARPVPCGPAMTAPPVLTPREWEVVRLFALGKTWEEICHDLHITRNTLMIHRSHAVARYSAETLIGLFRALGWLRVPRSYTPPPTWRQGA